MMSTSASFSVVLVIMIVLASGGAECARAKLPKACDFPESECEMVNDEFPSCLPFLTGLIDPVGVECCTAVNELNMAAKSAAWAPKSICRCIESIAKGLDPPLLYSQISKLPSACSTHLSFPISEHMNCHFH